jgi:hypothetical protein
MFDNGAGHVTGDGRGESDEFVCYKAIKIDDDQGNVMVRQTITLAAYSHIGLVRPKAGDLRLAIAALALTKLTRCQQPQKKSQGGCKCKELYRKKQYKWPQFS